MAFAAAAGSPVAVREIVMGYRVVLTADRTLMSSYGGSQFVGFAACFPRVLPKWLYTTLFCPVDRGFGALAPAAPAGLRRVEGALIGAGVSRDDVATVYPDRLARAVDEKTEVVGISTSDPLGCGPASSTFSNLLRKETYTRYFFRQLLNDPSLRRSRAKIIVGGPGAWQLWNEETRRDLGIDCLVEGEGDIVASRLFIDALEGRDLPSRVSGGPVPADQIPRLTGPTINGTVEISRGCGRGCEFCNPNMRTVRHIPLARILEEVRVNLAHCDKITLHAEDVLRYRASGMRPDRGKVGKLFEEVGRHTDRLGMSHIALSSALAEPGLIEDISRLVGAEGSRNHCYAQTGIETGSSRLVSLHMRGKAKPFAPEEWPMVVRESFSLLSDNHWTPCGTLVMGLPGEKAEDIRATIELVRDLREHKSLIVPLFFVPLGQMTSEGFFGVEDMLPEHWILLSECIDHDFRWAPALMDDLFAQNRLGGGKAGLLKLAAWYMKRRMKPYLEMMREGASPLELSPEELDEPKRYESIEA